MDLSLCHLDSVPDEIILLIWGHCNIRTMITWLQAYPRIARHIRDHLAQYNMTLYTCVHFKHSGHNIRLSTDIHIAPSDDTDTHELRLHDNKSSYRYSLKSPISVKSDKIQCFYQKREIIDWSESAESKSNDSEYDESADNTEDTSYNNEYIRYQYTDITIEIYDKLTVRYLYEQRISARYQVIDCACGETYDDWSRFHNTYYHTNMSDLQHVDNVENSMKKHELPKTVRTRKPINIRWRSAKDYIVDPLLKRVVNVQ